jgi:hypothetical protein
VYLWDTDSPSDAGGQLSPAENGQYSQRQGRFANKGFFPAFPDGRFPLKTQHLASSAGLRLFGARNGPSLAPIGFTRGGKF